MAKEPPTIEAKDTISIEGYIDVRGQNTDQKGVRQAIQQIDDYVAAASNSASVVEAITIVKQAMVQEQ